MKEQILNIYISPCPNDTFITYALSNTKVSSPQCITHFADIQELNILAQQHTVGIIKISVAVFAHIQKEYSLLSVGSAMGLGCGPIIVAKKGISSQEIQHGAIAIPGKNTTANALLSLHGGYTGERIEMLFSDIPTAVQKGDVSLGVLIHESRFEYAQYGLECIEDLGVFWEKTYAMPLPLGIFVIHNSLLEYKDTFEESFKQSIVYAHNHTQEVVNYCTQYAQELSPHVLQEHIRTFVNEYTYNMGIVGEKAIKTLLKALQ